MRATLVLNGLSEVSLLSSKKDSLGIQYVAWVINCVNKIIYILPNTAQKMKFSIEDFFSKCDQIRRKLRILLYFLMETTSLERKKIRHRFDEKHYTSENIGHWSPYNKTRTISTKRFYGKMSR